MTTNNQQVCVFLGNLSRDLTENDIHSLCSPYGKIASVSMTASNGKKQGVAFVTFACKQYAENAIRALHQSITFPGCSRPLQASYAINRKQVAHRTHGSNYVKPKHHIPVMSTVYARVTNLPKTCDESYVASFFASVAPVDKIWLSNHDDKKIAYVQFSTVEGAHEGAETLNGYRQQNGDELSVSLVIPQDLPESIIKQGIQQPQQMHMPPNHYYGMNQNAPLPYNGNGMYQNYPSNMNQAPIQSQPYMPSYHQANQPFMYTYGNNPYESMPIGNPFGNVNIDSCGRACDQVPSFSTSPTLSGSSFGEDVQSGSPTPCSDGSSHEIEPSHSPDFLQLSQRGNQAILTLSSINISKLSLSTIVSFFEKRIAEPLKVVRGSSSIKLYFSAVYSAQVGATLGMTESSFIENCQA